MRRPEDALQAACCDYLAVQEKMGRLLYASCPNAAKRSVKLATLMKRTGLRAGFPDLMVFMPNRVIFVELKAGKRKPTEAQDWWADQLQSFGFETYTIYSLEQLQAIFTSVGQ